MFRHWELIPMTYCQSCLVTNAHVVEGAAAITVVPAGSNRERPARFVGVSTCDDLAVIKLDDMGNLSFYLCYITSQATYGCGVFVDSQYTSLVEPTPSNLFYPADFNMLMMSAIGSRITFVINGTEVAAFDDSSVSRGIYAEGFSDVPGQASFDNVAMGVAP